MPETFAAVTKRPWRTPIGRSCGADLSCQPTQALRALDSHIMTRLLGRGGDGIACVSATAWLRYGNRQARESMLAGAPLRIEACRVVCADRLDTHRLHAAITSVARAREARRILIQSVQAPACLALVPLWRCGSRADQADYVLLVLEQLRSCPPRPQARASRRVQWETAADAGIAA